MHIQILTTSVCPKYIPTQIAHSLSAAFPRSLWITEISQMQQDSGQGEREESRLVIFNFCISYKNLSHLSFFSAFLFTFRSFTPVRILNRHSKSSHFPSGWERGICLQIFCADCHCLFHLPFQKETSVPSQSHTGAHRRTSTCSLTLQNYLCASLKHPRNSHKQQ